MSASEYFMSTPESLGYSHSLRELLASAGVAVADDVWVNDLTLDSRAVRPGAAFVALQGTRVHGLNYAREAVERGAAAILWEPSEGVCASLLGLHVPVIAVPRLSEVLGQLADRFFDAPSQSVDVIGVTGTNGKTTTAFLIASALERFGHPAAYAGTIGIGRVGALREATHTTPDSISVHRTIAELRDQQVRFLGMEVSSHALDQHRVAGVCFRTAVFTNLTHDHLDYHGTFEAYGNAKAALFRWPGLRAAIINVADAFGAKLASASQGAAALTVYSRTPIEPAQFPRAAHHLYANSVECAPEGLRVQLRSSWGAADLRSALIGEFNVDNALAAIAALVSCAIPFGDAVAAVGACVAPPGRMQLIGRAGAPAVIVDYAHTPDALEKALLAARRHCSGQLICVFGCGGDRDAAKRPIMGRIAEALADTIVVTDDNPRTEDGDRIVTAILSGMNEPAKARVERDRAQAIQSAIFGARPDDLVVVAGKGHEDYQIVGGVKRHFSDSEVAQAAVQRYQP